MITEQQLKSIGFVKDSIFYVKHELVSKYKIQLLNGEVPYILEQRGETIVKYPVHAHDINDLIIAYEIISGAIMYHESEEKDNNVYSLIICVLMALIGLLLIYTLLQL